MPTIPKSPKAIIKESLDAFDLEFIEALEKAKPCLGLAISDDECNDDILKSLDELRHIKHERDAFVYTQLSDRHYLNRLIGRIKNIRRRIDEFVNSDK